MTTLRFFKRDIKLGVQNGAWILLIPIIVSAAQSLNFHKISVMLKEFESYWGDGTIMDYYLYSMQGMRVFDFDMKQHFEIPIYWFVFQIGAAYFTAYYSHHDLTDNGKVLFIMPKSRSAWWYSKCLWCLVSVFIYYLVSIITIGCTAIFCGASLSLKHSELISRIIEQGANYLSGFDVLLVVIILPIVTTMAICMLQMFIGFFVSPEVSFALSCTVYVLSAYYTEWFLPGNFTMWQRSSYVVLDGLNPISGLVLGCFLILFSFYEGKLYFEKKDIL